MKDSPKMKITTMIEMTSNPLDQFSEFQIGLKRSADLTEEQWLDQDAELQHVIAVCDSRIPFISLEDALRNEEIPHSGIVSEVSQIPKRENFFLFSMFSSFRRFQTAWNHVIHQMKREKSKKRNNLKKF